MPIFSNALAGAAGSAGGAADFKIERSLRFDSESSSYLSRTPSSSGSNTTWTFSTWVKKTGNDCHILSAGAGNTPGRFALAFDGSDKINVFVVDSGSTVYSQNSDAVFRDPSAWYSIIVVADTANSTAADRLIVYVNGVRQTFSGGAMPLNQNTFVNTAAAHAIGRRSYTANDFFNGYLADTHLIDGQALAASDFGEFDADTGVWNPIEYTGDYNDAGTPGTQYSATSTISNASGMFDGNTSNYVSQAMPSSYQTVTTEPITFTLNNGSFTYNTNNCGATGGSNYRYLRLTRQSDGQTTELTSNDCNGWTIPNDWTNITISKIEWKRWTSYENVSAV